jgi:protein-tyrosine phosphatase
VPDFEQVANFRDAGGHQTVGGSRMRDGVVFRSGHLADATDRDLTLLERLGIGLIVDLRDPCDLAANGENRLPAGATLRRIAYPGDVPGGDIQALLATADRATIEAAFPPGSAYALVLDSSSQWSSDEGRRAQLAEVVRCIVDAEGAVLIQCSAGKDRTGFAAAVIQSILGVPEATVIGDYLRSNEARTAQNAKLLGALASRGVAAELLEPLLVLREDYMRVFLKAIGDDWGGIDGYMLRGLGVDAREVDALRRRLLDC